MFKSMIRDCFFSQFFVLENPMKSTHPNLKFPYINPSVSSQICVLAILLLMMDGCVAETPVKQYRQSQHRQNDTLLAPLPRSAKADMSAHSDDLRDLMLALYEAYPEELSKSSQVGPREMTDWVFDGKYGWRFDGLRRLQDQQALALLFDADFQGDHVLALIVGLETLLFHGYGADNEFAIPAQVDVSKMHHLNCQLQDFRLRYSHSQGYRKPIAMLQQLDTQHKIEAALYKIERRIQTGNRLPAATCPFPAAASD